jgi:SPX domain protein involved in polyphosphate accumulation
LFVQKGIVQELQEMRLDFRDIHSTSTPDIFRKAALDRLDALAIDAAFLQSFREMNLIGFQKILKKYDKFSTRGKSKQWFWVKVKESDVYNLDFNTLLAALALGYREWRRELHVPADASHEAKGTH